MSKTGQDINPTELLNACLKGDRKSQEQLYRKFYSYAMGICMRYTHSKDDAMEILNDGFLKVFLKAEQFDTKYPFKAWLKRIMVNTAIDHTRKNAKHQYNDDIETAYNVYAEQADAVDDLNYEALLGLIQKLKPNLRAVFNMYVIDGYSHEEIAESLAIPVGTSKSQLSRAREVLKEMLQGKTFKNMTSR
jgi:RNA polymerase sigma factor (sigma-70 family)